MTQDNNAQCKTWQMPSVNSAGNGQINAASYMDELQQLKQNAHREGYDAGYAEGLQKGTDEINRQLQQLHETLALFNEPLALINEDIEQQLLVIIELITRSIVHREVSLNPEILFDVFKQMKAVMPLSKEKIILQLHPEDQAHLAQFLQEHQIKNECELTVDPNLSRGEVVLITQHTQIDGTIAGRMNAVAEQLLRSSEA